MASISRGQRREDERPEYVEVVVAPPEDSWIANVPWWAISAGIHVLFLMIMSFVYMERLLAVEGTGTVVTVSPRSAVLPYKPEPLDPGSGPHTIPNYTDEASPPSTDPIIFDPEAKLSDHNESEDNEDYRQMKGDSRKFLSYIKGEAGGFRGRQAVSAKGVYDAMGVGPGGGGAGRHGGPFGGREKLRVGGPGGCNTITEDAVRSALRWLARHQAGDGRWDSDGFAAECGRTVKGSCGGPGYPEYDTGVTSLALLAFLGAGYTHLSRDVYDDICFGTVVKKGVQWLIANQDTEGCVGGRSASKYLYNHSIAALALSEAYGMTTSEILKEPAQRSIHFLIASQNPGLAWRYAARCGDNDTSVTGWAVMALKSAKISGLQAPPSGYDGAKAWLNQVTGADCRVGYNARDTGKVVVENKNEHFDHHETLAAIGVMSRIFMSKNRADPALKGGVDHLLKDLPAWNGTKIDFYYWYCASLALFQFDGPRGASWKAWDEHMKNALVTNQKRRSDGCQNGSWDPIDRWGFEGGRVYSTAINALTLEVYYRYENVFGVK
jgi:hypothetical protein